MTISNKSVRAINKTLAKITKKMPVSVTITKKPSKLQTAFAIVAGVACYAYGIYGMYEASKPTFITYPVFNIPQFEE